jgi:transcriptional regulator
MTKIKKYLEELQKMRSEFEQSEICHILRTYNKKVDALSKLAVESNLNKGRPVIVLEVSRPSVDVEYAEQFQAITMDE